MVTMVKWPFKPKAEFSSLLVYGWPPALTLHDMISNQLVSCCPYSHILGQQLTRMY